MKPFFKSLLLIVVGALFTTLMFFTANKTIAVGEADYIYIWVQGDKSSYTVTTSSTTGIYEVTKFDIDKKELKGPGDFAAILNIIKKYESDGFTLTEYGSGIPITAMGFVPQQQTFILKK